MGPKYPVAKMPLKRFVEIGRITVLQDGPHEGKIAAIVDVIDQNRVLLDGPCSGVERQEYRIKNLHLTPLKITFPFSARSKVVRKAWEDEKVTEKWAESGWSKRMVMKARRQGLNDFDRFKLMRPRAPATKFLLRPSLSRKTKCQRLENYKKTYYYPKFVCNKYPANDNCFCIIHWIQQPIRKIRIQNFH